MNGSLSIYLDKVDRYLKPMSASERADIINEIKSEMAELEKQGHLSEITSVLGIGLMLCGVVAPLSGLVKLLGHMVGIEVPWVSFQFGSYSPNPYITFFLSLIMGVLLGAAGLGLWKFTVKFVQMISKRNFKKEQKNEIKYERH